MTAPPRAPASARAAFTLVELLVVLAVLGVSLGIAGIAFHRARTAPTADELVLQRIATMRHEAIAAGRDVSTTVMLDGQPHAVTARPDGSVLADSLPALDPMSGRPSAREHGDARP